MIKCFVIATACLVLLSCNKDKEVSEIIEVNNTRESNPLNPNGVPNGTYFNALGYVFNGSFYAIDSIGNIAVYISPCDHSITNITIPPQIEIKGRAYTVTQIYNDAFNGLSQLTSVRLPYTITSLGKWAFSGCESLTTINLPEGLKDINDYSFYRCKALASITLPKNLTSINGWAFSECESLTSVDLPSTLNYIGQEAFSRSGLTSFVISNDLTQLCLDAFKNCKSLTSFSISGHIQYYYYPFSGCDALTSVTISTSVVTWGFGTNFTELILGENVQSIVSGAFQGCQQLKNVTCYAIKPPSIPKEEYGYSPAFEKETEENGILYVPSASVNAYKISSGWNRFKHIVGI